MVDNRRDRCMVHYIPGGAMRSPASNTFLLALTLLSPSWSLQEQQQQQQQASAFLPRTPSTVPSWCSPSPYSPGEEMYTHMVRTHVTFKTYHNVYWHTQRMYAVLPPHIANLPNQPPLPASAGVRSPGNSATAYFSPSLCNASETFPMEEGLSVNTAAIRLPSSDAGMFVDTLRLCYLPGTTLLVDFPFPALADNHGHWLEILLPTHSVLLDGAWRSTLRRNRSDTAEAAGSAARSKPYIDRVLLPNLRKHFNDFFRVSLALSLAPGLPPLPAGSSPKTLHEIPIVDSGDLEAYDKLSWVVFENLLVVQDRYTHPQRLTGFPAMDHGDLWTKDGCARFVDQELRLGFATQKQGHAFREAAYRYLGWPAPPAWTPGQPPPLPRLLTLLTHHEDYPVVVNNDDLHRLVHEMAPQHSLIARQVSLSTDTPFSSVVDVFSSSALVLARHGPLLASSIFMTPGSAVLELLPYKWEWRGISQLYHNMTQSMGDLHHWAWRPQTPDWCAYREKNDTRYIPWTPEECSARECLMVHARAGLRANIDTLRELMGELLAGMRQGRSVADMRRPWPQAS